MTVTRQLIERAFETARHPAALPAARRALFDYLACVTAGREVSALGDDIACAVLDLDDVHWPTGTHPGSMVWPSALGGDRWSSAPSALELRAACVGYEVMIRVARAFGPEHRRTWHPTSTAGVLGAAAAAAVAGGLDLDGVAGCVSHATSLAGGLMQGLAEGADSGLVHRAHARASALVCMRCAALRPPASGIDGPQGLLAAFGGTVEPLLAGAAEPAIAQTTFRAAPASGLLQGLAATAFALRGRHGREIRVGLPQSAIALSDRPRPATPADRWWSAQWTVAACLHGLDRRAMLAGASTADVDALAALVRLEAAEQPFLSIDGHSHAIEARPEVSDRGLVEKWRWLNPDEPPPAGLLGLDAGTTIDPR